VPDGSGQRFKDQAGILRREWRAIYDVSGAGGSHRGPGPAVPDSAVAARPVIPAATRLMKFRIVAAATRCKIARSSPAPSEPSGGR
jgi:hypothetical protein